MFHYSKAIFICFSCDSEASFFPSTYPREKQGNPKACLHLKLPLKWIMICSMATKQLWFIGLMKEYIQAIDWREVADNWFGGCCCSFGGISEKLVTRFANSYRCAKDMLLLS
ncbi:hypothetical protein E1A91_D06G092500v1 [Gossypium mustelinum]|uniref:Uncharacterized protein n=1 Tax=Gossypium mustelinum TaxID=34275 RepID=A0A5D2UJE0_GOSMU|nr:hypothetical protein E1A91_D06G092500v1 [Gossypium mustelinum]